MSVRPAPQVDEDIVGIEVAVLAVQVIGVEPDQLGADRDRPRHARLRASAVVVGPRDDGHLPFGGGDVGVPQAQRLADPDAAVPQQREQEPIPQPLAGVEDRLSLRDREDTRELAGRRQLDRAPRLPLPLADVMQERLPSRTPPAGRLPGGQQFAEVHPLRAACW
nr:hypothetical protein [Kribbella steppae]